MKIDPLDASNHFNLGRLLAQDPLRLKDAEAAYRKAISLAPADPFWYGKRIIRATLRMDSANHYAGHGVADVIDATGMVTSAVFSADVEGRRMALTSP